MRVFIKQIQPHIWIGGALTLLILPLRWVFGWLLAAIFHEVCHYVAVRLCGGRLQSLAFSAHGAHMTASSIGGFRELLCILAGPMGGLLLVAFFRYFPVLATCALLQTLYNLLPVLPLDGGHALECMLALFLSSRAVQVVMSIIACMVMMSLAAIGLYCSIFLGGGLLPLILVVQFAWNMNFIKIPCKLRHKRVQ